MTHHGIRWRGVALLLLFGAIHTSAGEVPPAWGITQFDFDCPGCATVQSENAAIGEVIANHDFGCGASATPDGGWYWNNYQGLSLSDETLHLARKSFTVSYDNDPPACQNTINDSHVLTMQRPSLGCPDGYNGPFTVPQPDGPYLVCTTADGARDYFENPHTADCPPMAGNPCELTTGAKIETFVDYSGPGIEFFRTYRSNMLSIINSMSAQEFPLFRSPYGVLGGNWTHNYASQLAYDIIPVVPTYWLNPEGVLIQWVEVEPDVFVAADGSGIQLRPADPANKGGEDWIIYYPSGAKEIHRWMTVGSYGGTRLHLKELHDPAGRVTTVNYRVNSNGYVSGGVIDSVTGPFGHTLTFAYTSSPPYPSTSPAKFDFFTDPAGNRVEYVHNYQDVSANGSWLRGVIFQDGASTWYRYEDHTPSIIEPRDFLLRGIVDGHGVEHATFEYWDIETQGLDLRTRSTRHGTYETTSFSYAFGGESTTAIDALGNRTVYEFQPAAEDEWVARYPGSVTAPDGTSTAQTNESGAQHRVVERVDANGVVTRYDYDRYHLVRMREGFDAGVSSQDSSDDTWARETILENLNDTSSLRTLIRRPSASCNNRFRDISISYVPGTQWVSSITESGYSPQNCNDAISRTTTYSDFNEFGQPRRIVGPRNVDRLDIEYYECTDGGECGQVRSVSNALGHRTTYSQYDSHGRVAQIIDPNGIVTNYTYTLSGLIDTINADGWRRGTRDRLRLRRRRPDRYGAIPGRPRAGTSTGMKLTCPIASRIAQGNAITFSYDERGNLQTEHVISGTTSEIRPELWSGRITTRTVWNGFGQV